jgi:hypothetical protein
MIAHRAGEGEKVTKSNLPIIIACPCWSEDGAWGRWTNLEHTRAVLGLPMDFDTLGKVATALQKCRCGKTLVVLTQEPAAL